MNIQENAASRLIKEVEEQTEKNMLSQLKGLVNKGLLIVKRGPSALIQEWNGELRVLQSIELEVPQQEVIGQLEEKVASLTRENNMLREELDSIRVLRNR